MMSSKSGAPVTSEDKAVERVSMVRKEYEYTLKLADYLLDVPYADPDDDLRMLARQFLCAVERNDKRVADIKNCVDIQKQNLGDEYMRGMANGLIVALSILDGNEPVFVEPRNEPRLTMKESSPQSDKGED